MTETVIAPSRGRVLPLLFAFVGIPIVALLGFFWLEIPDSHIWQLAFSLGTGVIIAAAFIWLVASAVRAIRKPASLCPAWLGMVVLTVWMSIVWTLVSLGSRIDDNASARAGYIVSKQSSPVRATFTYERLITLQHDAMLVFLWIAIPVLLTPFVIEAVSSGISLRAWRVAARVVLRWQHWLAIVVCDAAIYWLTGRLTGWRPSHSVHGELISLAIRLVLCYLIDFALVVLLLFIDSKLLAREHARRYTAAQPSANVP